MIASRDWGPAAGKTASPQGFRQDATVYPNWSEPSTLSWRCP
jgi:hypothetical protein